MNHLLEEAEQKYDGDFERMEKEKELEDLKDRIRELEEELGKRKPVEKIDFLASFPKPKYIPKKYLNDPDRAYEEWIDAKVERGEF